MPLFGVAVEHSKTKITSGAAQVTLEQFAPKKGGHFPAVIALHGSGGILESSYLQPAEMLAGAGFGVFIPHYFDTTGDLWPDHAACIRDWPIWMEVVKHTLDYTSAQPFIDPTRTALVGFSLGAYLALSVAGHDERVKAVVEFFGALPEDLNHTIERMPPVLILHGEHDDKVPVAEAHKLEQLLQQHGREYEIKIYQGAGHIFRGFTLMDSAQRTLAFLKRHLKQ